MKNGTENGMKRIRRKTKYMNFVDTTGYREKGSETNKFFFKSDKKNTFQYLDLTSVHIPSVFKGFTKGKTIRHLRNTNNCSELEKVLS